jgi:hypothetical protein
MTIPNQAPDSSVSGYLQPIPTPPGLPEPLGSQDLDNYIQQMVAAVAGIDEILVRPRFQPEPPNLPDFVTDWVAVGVQRHRPIGFVQATIHHPEGNGHDETQRHEEIDVLASFYGPRSNHYATNFHNGMLIWQNRSLMRLVGMSLVEVGDGIRAPELVKNLWLDRMDKTVTLRRIIRRDYPVLNLLRSKGYVIPNPGHGYQAPWDTNNLVVPTVLETHWDDEQTIWDDSATRWHVHR